MSKKLFFGNLSFKTTEDGLREFAAKMGAVDEVKIITDRETQRSRGFGFVTMADDAVADQAIAELNGKDLDGRTIVVNEARERTGGGGGGGRRSGGGNNGGSGRSYRDRNYDN